MRTGALLALVCALGPQTTSCWAIGLTVGGTMPREETLTPAQSSRGTPEFSDLPQIGEDVEIELRSGRVVKGEYRGVQYGAFAVNTESGLRPAPVNEVREIRAVRGSYAAAGFAIGLGVDVVALSVLSKLGHTK